MSIYRWYAHSWYFNTGWLRTLELGFDLRNWIVGVTYQSRTLTMAFGPILVSYGSPF